MNYLIGPLNLISIYDINLFRTYSSIHYINSMATKKPASAPTNKKTTLDIDYTKQAKQFTSDYKQLPVKKKKLKQLTAKLELYNEKPMLEMETEEIDNFYQLKNEISELEKEINKTENLSEMTDFYLKTGELLINYYDNLNQDSSDKKKGRPSKVKKSTLPEAEPIANMLSFFKSGDTTKTQTPIAPIVASTDQSSQPKPDTQLKTIQSLIKTNSTFQRADIYEQYRACTDPHHIAAVEYNGQDDFCSDCGEFRELMTCEALLVCPKCGDEVQAVMESDKPSYKDPPHENMYFAYKRINHFKEQLSHFQAKETTKIPQEVYDVILVEFKKEKKTNLASLTIAKVRRYLQKYTHLGYNKYYENVNQIICHLNGMQPLSMPPDVEEQLCNMFQKIQEPFEKHCPPDRTNFLSYSYVIHKFCQLLGYYEYLPYFNLLKSKEKLHQQDKIWKKICVDLGWKYFSSSH